MYNIFEVVIGLVACILIFYRKPMLLNEKDNLNNKRISVIIPARNEEDNLEKLLHDLKVQTRKVDEIICIDDHSEDKTTIIAQKHADIFISAGEIPEGWIGKNWACNIGVEAATGEIFIFIDADVRLRPNAIAKLEATFVSAQCTISVQPFHIIKQWHEYFSYFLNLIQICANGVGWPFWNKNIGLFGPVIMISREDYMFIGGHKSVKNSIVEDVSLGEEMRNHGLKFKLFLGGKDISFRMYSNGVGELIEGWTKNMASGAMKTPLLILLLVVLWFDAITSVFVNLVRSIIDYNLFAIAAYSVIYIFTVILLWTISRRVGNFKFSWLLLYPVFLVACFVIFVISIFKRFILKETSWKGRKIGLGVKR